MKKARLRGPPGADFALEVRSDGRAQPSTNAEVVPH